MNVLVLHNATDPKASVDEQDVLVQRDAVLAALRALGHEAGSLACSLDLSVTWATLRERRPDMVFNLVESLGGTDQLMPVAPLVLEALGLRYTGCSTAAILSTNHKPQAKRLLRAAGLPTPDWLEGRDATPATDCEWRGRFIIKPLGEHASLGIDDGCIVEITGAEALRGAIGARERSAGCPQFAERFVDGREFNLSLLTRGAAAIPEVLPPAEIEFVDFGERPRVVGYRAKWDAGSFEYEHTPRRFDFPTADMSLLVELGDLARRCWTSCQLSGYARVDFRIDKSGRPWILEVNANPCLAPDAGFAAALERAGITFGAAIDRIVRAAS